MPDPFGTLPLPLPLLVLKALEDLSTLQFILVASRPAAALFEQYHCEIVESIIAQKEPYLQDLVRKIVSIPSHDAAIQEPPIPFVDQRYINMCRNPQDVAISHPLRKTMVDHESMRDMVRTASKIQMIAQRFFDIHLARANNIKPSRLVDEQYEYSMASSDPPEGQYYQPMQCGPPSWVEEQRVLRALWRLELYFCLASTTDDDTRFNGMTRDALLDGGPRILWADNVHSWELDELDSVYEFLTESEANRAPSFSGTNRPSKLPMPGVTPVTLPKRVPDEDETTAEWMQSRIHLWRPSHGANFFPTLRILPFSPLFNTSFTPFRRLGFTIWGLERMAKLGLANVPPDLVSSVDGVPLAGDTTQDDLWFRWKSLLDSDT